METSNFYPKATPSNPYRIGWVVDPYGVSEKKILLRVEWRGEGGETLLRAILPFRTRRNEALRVALQLLPVDGGGWVIFPDESFTDGLIHHPAARSAVMRWVPGFLSCNGCGKPLQDEKDGASWTHCPACRQAISMTAVSP